MASMHYSPNSQAAAQQGYSAFTTQPTQEYAETTQMYGQQSYGTYGQPTDISYTQAQTMATYGQAGYATSYGLPPTGYITPAAPQVYSPPVQEYGPGAYDAIAATVTTIHASYAAQFACDTQPSYPVYGEQPEAAILVTLQDGNEFTETNQPQCSTWGYSQPSLGYGQSNYSYPQVPGSYPVQLDTVPPSYPPTIHSFTQPTSYDQSSYSQQNIFGQPSSYGQQNSYGQQRSYGWQPPISYLPQIGSFSEAPSQYSQQIGSYRQQSSLRQDYPCSMCIYEQETGGFFRPSENWYMSGPDNWGRGRGRIDHGGMSRGGRRQGRGRKGSRGKRGGFNKPSGLTDEGPDLDLGPPVDPDEDTNSAIFIQGLNGNVTLDDLADLFKQCGVVKVNKRTGQPMIHICLDKETGKPKGDAMVSYVDPPTAKAAVEFFDGKDFQGSKLKVSFTQKKPPVDSMQGGVSPHGGRRMPTPLGEGPGDPGGPEGPKGHMGGQGGEREGFPPRGPRGSRGNISGGRNVQRRARDWQCPNPGCRNHNFAWRTQCHQCKAPKPEVFLPPPFLPPGGHYSRGGPAGMQGGRGGLMDLGGPGGMFRGGRGGDRGSFHVGYAMDRGGFGRGRQGGPGAPLGPSKEQMGRKRGEHGGPGKSG